MRASEILMVGGALAIIPLGMGGISLVKLLFFAFAALIGATTIALRHQQMFGFCGVGLHGAPTDTVRICRASECSPAPHCLALPVGSLALGFLWMFFVVVFLSPLWSIAPFFSVVGVEPRFEGVMAYVVFFGLALIAGGMVRGGREPSLLSVILWSNVGVVLYGLIQAVGLDPFSGWWEADVFLGRAFSTIGQPNMLGQFLLLTAPFAMLTVWRRRENPLSQWERVRVRGYPLATVTLFMGNLLVLFATGSRAGMVGAMVGGGFFVWHVLPRAIRSPFETARCVTLRDPGPVEGLSRSATSGPLRVTRMVTAMPVSCGVGILLFVSLISFFLFSQRFSLHGEWDRSLHGRLAIWRDAGAMIRERPQGWGLETTGLLFPHFQSSPLTAYESLTTSVDRAHSKPFDLLLTVGPLGLLSYYAFLMTLLSHCLRAWWRRGDTLALAGIVSLMGVSVSLLFGFEGITVHAFFWLICGMLAGLPLPAIRPPVQGPRTPQGLERRAHGREAGEGRGEGQGERVRLLSALSPDPSPAAAGEGGKGIPLAVSTVSVLLFMVVALTTLSLSSRVTAHRAEQALQRGEVATAVQEYANAIRWSPFDRALLIRFLETALLARERAENVETEDLLNAAIGKHLHHLNQLTSGRDSLLPSLAAWHAAWQGEKQEALGFLDDAKRRAPFSIPRLRIAAHVAHLLTDRTLEETLRVELLSLLPKWWHDPQDPRHRILLKENPWLRELLL